MPKEYSKELKWRVVYLWNYGYPIEKISQLLYIDRSTIFKVLNYYILLKDVKDPLQKQRGKIFFNNSDLRVCIFSFNLLLINLFFFILRF